MTTRPAGPGHLVAAAVALVVLLTTGCSASSPTTAASATASPAPTAASATPSAEDTTGPAAPTGHPGPAQRSTNAPAGANGSFEAFAGEWVGHTRTLTVSPSGRGEEHVNDGCCTTVLDMTLQLSAPRGTGHAHATATATVLTLDLHGNHDPGSPRVGQRGTVSISDGVLTDELSNITYCDPDQLAQSTCGA
ncbi:MAG TPA: hypothetical protein VH141_03620 [Pseudonocardia sp.]|nr:hypothetical protein [Pseudonocardia sp.]